MRDPARIDRMIAKLRVIWKRNPDLRLGQLVEEAARWTPTPVFYAEDEAVEAGLDEMAKSWGTAGDEPPPVVG